MPEKKTLKRVEKAKREGKSPSTQAGEFIREEIEHIRKGKHGARSTKQAIAIGLQKARRAGIPLPPPSTKKVSAKTKKSAESAFRKGQKGEPISRTRSFSTERALKKEPRKAASHKALSRQARQAARKRSPLERSLAARKAARTRKRAS